MFSLAALLLAEELPAAARGDFAAALREFRAGTTDEEFLFQSARTELLKSSPAVELKAAAHGSNYLSAAKAVNALRPRALAAAAQRLGLDARSDQVYPWDGPEQEPGWRPEWTEIAVTNAPRVLTPIPADVVGGWIPARYRVAEVLGLGTNRVHAALLLVDPAFETGSIPRYVVESVIRYTLVGTFQPLSERGTNGHVRTNASADSPALETFRRELDSRRRVIHLRIHAGREVRPDRTSEVDSGFEEVDTGRAGGWVNDRLADRLTTHSRPVGRSGVQAAEVLAEQALSEALDTRLKAWRQATAAELERLAIAEGIARKLADSRAALIAAELGPETLRAADLLPAEAGHLPTLVQLAAPCDFREITGWVRLAELHALVHTVELEHRDRAVLTVLAVREAIAEARSRKEPKGTP